MTRLRAKVDPSERLSIGQCNQRRVLVLFDCNVLIDARGRDPVALGRLLRIDAGLRHVALVTLYEFAYQGDYATSGRRQQEWLSSHAIKPLRFAEIAASIPPARRKSLLNPDAAFEQSLDLHGETLRARSGLGDALLFAACRALESGGIRTAVATKNLDDFRALPIRLVEDFL